MTRHRTQDRAGTGAGPPVGIGGMHTTEQIGPRRHRTPEGYLLCEDVPIARTGPMYYGPGETPVRTNDKGYSIITRDESTLFNPVTMMSFAGKPVTNDHPLDGRIAPHNWQRLAVGSVLNVRRGTGDDADTLRADLLITDARAILDVESGKREVSAGYDADYQTTGVGEGRQIHIIGNHIALVKKGRCGPRCAIGDRQPVLPSATSRGFNMPRTTTRQVSDAQRAQLMTALGLDNEDEIDDEDAGHVHVHLHNGPAAGKPGATNDGTVTMDAAVDQRFTAIEGSIAELVKAVTKLTVDGGPAPRAAGKGPDDEEEEDDAAAGKDSKALEAGFKTLVADAEVLIPGFKVPTFDAATERKKMVESMCALRRRVLDTINLTADGAKMLTTVAGSAVDTVAMGCGEIAGLFRSAAGAKRMMNNGASTAGAGHVAITADAAAAAARAALPIEQRGPKSVSELNEMHRKMYGTA